MSIAVAVLVVPVTEPSDDVGDGDHVALLPEASGRLSLSE
jgi:hypothetical protein